YFFFSSRRRHTRSTRDWSSDVCSSDLHDYFLDLLGAGLGWVELGRRYVPLFGHSEAIFNGCGRSAMSRMWHPVCLPIEKYSDQRSEERRVGKECRCRW